jgi:hypothetical protein
LQLLDALLHVEVLDAERALASVEGVHLSKVPLRAGTDREGGRVV